MKVLIDGLCLQQSGLGIRRCTNYLIDSYIKRYGKDNVKVIISKVTGDEFYDYILYKGSKRYIVQFFVFHRFLRNIEFDLFHSPANTNYCFKVKGRFYVTTVHDIMYKVVPFFYSRNKFVNYLKVRLTDLYTYFSMKNSDLVISISETTRQDLLIYFKKDSIVIPNGVVALPNHNQKTHSFLEINNIPPKSYFLYVGSDKLHKNVDFLIRSFLRARTEKKLVICGFKRDNAIGFNGRIIFTGYITDGELSELYKNADAFVFPSLYEGFGLPILEALQYGINVYSSNGGALKEFPDSLVSFFNPTNETELISLIEQSNKHEVNKGVLSDYLSNFNWNVVLKKLQDVIARCYEEKLKTTPPR